MEKTALVIGATGLLGYGITCELCREGWDVRAIGRELINTRIFPNDVKYASGNFYDETFLAKSLHGVDKVFFFLSSTFPSTSTDSLELEINSTLKGLDYLIRNMRRESVNELIFPSSGGTVYGNHLDGLSKETDILHPITPYGIGKMMCEYILSFYSEFGISTTILRIGNVYGSPMIRKAKQGVIDLFVQKALKNEVATIWGDILHYERDYIFADDFSRAVVKIASKKVNGVQIFNLGSGYGTTLETIIDIINKYVNNPLKINYIQYDSTFSIKRIILDMKKFHDFVDFEYEYDIESGIKKTIERKKHIQRLI